MIFVLTHPYQKSESTKVSYVHLHQMLKNQKKLFPSPDTETAQASLETNGKGAESLTQLYLYGTPVYPIPTSRPDFILARLQLTKVSEDD